MADNNQRLHPPPNRRRDKLQLSCDPCRHRKLRCDRERPCGACSRRGLMDHCVYPTALSTRNIQTSVAPRQSSDLHGRISELESLVLTFMKGQSHPSSPSFAGASPKIQKSKNSKDKDAVPVDPGTLKLRESGLSYVQSDHWESILTKIRGLKEDLVFDSKSPLGSHLFYGPNRHATRDEILAAVPPRPVVDRLMALHFDTYFVTSYLIHSKKFLREYEMFWEDPSVTSIAWIGLMFSMLHIAAHLQVFNIDLTGGEAESLKAEHLSMRYSFSEKAIQCLILARYTTGGPYILETLIMILTGEFVLSKDSATDGWLFINTILHLAMRMGYHRDPAHFPRLSSFECEMRRRIWTTILQLDLSLSLEMGLPRSATDAHIDTKEPSNLRDCDFEEDTTEMPPSRPETEWTPVLALIARARLIKALGMICDLNTNVGTPSYAEIVKVDALLEDVYNHAIPPVLRWRTMPHPITDSPNLVIQRVSVETTYYKSRILLYRRALLSYPSRQSQPRDRESMRICLDSALKILSFQEMLHEESQPFGRLCQLRWKVTHIFNQDVLLATSVLCLYLQDVDKFEPSQTTGHATWSSTAEEIRQRLMISQKIWLQMSTTSPEAAKVAKALNIVLGNTEATGQGIALASHDFLPDLDPIPLNELCAPFDDQYFTSGFYSPLTFFDSVLETQGT